MAKTRPLEPTESHVRHYSLRVLSSSKQEHVPDEELRLRVIRVPSEEARRSPTKGWLRLVDPAVSRVHLELQARPGHVQLRDSSSNGTWVGPIRVRQQTIEIPSSVNLRVGETELRLEVEENDRPASRGRAHSLRGFERAGPAIAPTLSRADRLAQTDLPILITGETGTGKTTIARAIHERSKRAAGPFKVVDCASISTTLIESELFGHRRGAFTHAFEAREGIFEAASGGTVLIDEIGDLPLDAQGKLLRVLEEKRVRRVGENEERPIKVRVIAATHRDLASMVSDERFRLDLFERLAVGTIEMPPLRARREELDALCKQLVEQIRRDGEVDVPEGFALSPELEAAIGAREWVGNIRELLNFLRYYLATGELPPERALRSPTIASQSGDSDLFEKGYAEAHEEVLRRFDRGYLTHHLRVHGGKIQQASAAIGLHRVTFARRMQECGVKKQWLRDSGG